MRARRNPEETRGAGASNVRHTSNGSRSKRLSVSTQAALRDKATAAEEDLSAALPWWVER